MPEKASTPRITPGKCIILLVNLVTMVGAYVADWNETHIYNPNWPPHARYHNGQTMSMGLFIGLITFYTLYYLIPQTTSPKVQRIHLTWIVLLQSLIYLSSLSGILYPGAAWEDPEFGNKSPQLYLFPPLVGLCCVGWYLETRRLARVTRKKGM